MKKISLLSFCVSFPFLPLFCLALSLLLLLWLLPISTHIPRFSFLFIPSAPRAALTATTELYNSVDDSLHRLVRVSNERGRDLDALRKLVALEERLNKVSRGWGGAWKYYHSVCNEKTTSSNSPFPSSTTQCEKELEQLQEQLEEFKDTPLSLSKLSLKQQKFKAFRESAMVSVG